MNYELIITGQLDSSRKSWFEGLTINFDPLNDLTVLKGNLRDHAELYGVINKIRDLGLLLVSLRCLNVDPVRPEQI